MVPIGEIEIVGDNYVLIVNLSIIKRTRNGRGSSPPHRSELHAVNHMNHGTTTCWVMLKRVDKILPLLL